MAPHYILTSKTMSLTEEAKNPPVQFVTLYGVYESEEWPKNIVAYYEDNATAKHKAAGRGWYGGNADIGKFDCIKIGDDYYRVHSMTPIRPNYGPEQIEIDKKAALAKLTDFEKGLLGLKV